jgi:glutaredoxin 2
MIESLGPVVSLFKLFIDGLGKAIKLPAGYKRNKFCRKIVIFQIHLEDIIENAHLILDMLDQYNGKQLLEDKTKIHELSEMVESQSSSINGILSEFDDQSMMNVLKTFTPDTRRKLEILLYDKGAVLADLSRMLRILSHSFEKRSIPENFFPNMNLVGWNHADFVTKGRSFISTLHVDSKHSINKFCQRLNKQDQVLKELEGCSNELSDFISQHMNLNEVIKWQNKTNKS